MVQLKYFGDSRDFFKYDLITHLLCNMRLDNYAFIPMLTHHRDDNEGNVVMKTSEGRSLKLYEFIKTRQGKKLEHWQDWLSQFVKSYLTIEPVDEIYFIDNERDNYWLKYDELIKIRDALVFLDPDTGLETGNKGYLNRIGRNKYILNNEIKYLLSNLHYSSVMMFYQHLPRNRHLHDSAVLKKINQLSGLNTNVKVCSYRENDLAFMLVSKDCQLHNRLKEVIIDYKNCVAHEYSAIF